MCVVFYFLTRCPRGGPCNPRKRGIRLAKNCAESPWLNTERPCIQECYGGLWVAALLFLRFAALPLLPRAARHHKTSDPGVPKEFQDRLCCFRIPQPLTRGFSTPTPSLCASTASWSGRPTLDILVKRWCRGRGPPLSHHQHSLMSVILILVR